MGGCFGCCKWDFTPIRAASGLLLARAWRPMAAADGVAWRWLNRWRGAAGWDRAGGLAGAGALGRVAGGGGGGLRCFA